MGLEIRDELSSTVCLNGSGFFLSDSLVIFFKELSSYIYDLEGFRDRREIGVSPSNSYVFKLADKGRLKSDCVFLCIVGTALSLPPSNPESKMEALLIPDVSFRKKFKASCFRFSLSDCVNEIGFCLSVPNLTCFGYDEDSENLDDLRPGYLLPIPVFSAGICDIF